MLAPLERELIRAEEERGVEEITEERALEEGNASDVGSYETVQTWAVHTDHPRGSIGKEEELDAA